MIATTELVVPRSIPITLGTSYPPNLMSSWLIDRHLSSILDSNKEYKS